MKVEFTVDFLYSFDGINPTPLAKGESMDLPEKVAKSLIASNRAKVYVQKVSAPPAPKKAKGSGKKTKKED